VENNHVEDVKPKQAKKPKEKREKATKTVEETV
jgi:hypothetical protein